MTRAHRRWSKKDAPEDWSELGAIRDIMREMMSPLDREPRLLVSERCVDCHVPLHEGRELHYAWRRLDDRRAIVRVMKSHRCTARASIVIPIPLVNGVWKMADS